MAEPLLIKWYLRPNDDGTYRVIANQINALEGDIEVIFPYLPDPTSATVIDVLPIP